jgi:Lipoxygenase
MTKKIISGTVFRSSEDKSPFRNTRIEIWDRDFLVDDQLGVALTDDNGQFDLEYDTDDAGDEPDLLIKIFRLNANDEFELIFDQDGGTNITVDTFTFDIRIIDWEYDPNFVVPLIRTPNAAIDSSPQDFSASQKRKIISNGVVFGALRLLADRASSIQDVQNIFPPNYTVENRDESRSDKFFVEAVLNGFAPALLTFDSDNMFHVRYSVDDYEWDGFQQAPSAHLVLRKDLSGNLIPDRIEWGLKEINSNTITYGSASPSSSTLEWDKAKEYFRIAEFIDGEITGHLGRSHINVGQYAIALYRNLQKSPILKLLHPHLKEVSAINSFGKGIIFGEEGVLSTSPLTKDSVLLALRDDLGKCNWKNWSPRKPFDDQHYYAYINNLYWEILNEYIDEYFVTYRRKIILDWKEIFYFSEDLHTRSVPFKSSDPHSGEKWYCDNEISKSSENGLSISRITKVKNNPPDADIENLKQVCVYAIYHSTMWHDWRNDNQAKYAGEIDYARMALNYDVKDASFQLFVMNILNSIKYGYILKNEDKDIPVMLISKLKSRIDNFKSYGYDLRDLRSRINI